MGVAPGSIGADHHPLEIFWGWRSRKVSPACLRFHRDCRRTGQRYEEPKGSKKTFSLPSALAQTRTGWHCPHLHICTFTQVLASKPISFFHFSICVVLYHIVFSILNKINVTIYSVRSRETHIFLKWILRFSISSWERSWKPSNDLSFLVLKKMEELQTLAMAAARSFRRALKLCSRETISASIWSSFAESPLTHGWSSSCSPHTHTHGI